MTTSHNNPDDGFDFIRRMWGNMGFGLPGMVSPTLDVEEIERRIQDLKAVEGWLKMNLGMLQMTIQGLEVQRSTLSAMQAMSKAGSDADQANPFANPALWNWPFAPATPAGPAPAGGAEAAASPAKPPQDNTGTQ